jgi:osmotically-inducible protein OsmY
VTADITDDTAIQAEIDKRIADDPNLSKLDVTATVTNGRVILVGTVPTNELKSRIEKLARAVKGVKEVDNQIAAVSGP